MELRGLADLICPVPPDHRILNMRQKLAHEAIVGEDTDHFHQRHTRHSHRGQHRIPRRMLEARANDSVRCGSQS